jgi:hypothetical protein
MASVFPWIAGIPEVDSEGLRERVSAEFSSFRIDKPIITDNESVIVPSGGSRPREPPFHSGFRPITPAPLKNGLSL